MSADKVVIQDLNILYILLFNRFGTLQMRALEDILFMRDMGANPKVFCFKNSIIEEKLNYHGIETITFNKKKLTGNFDINYYLTLKKILKKEQFSVIHCYGLRSVWVICLALRSYFKTGLILTLNTSYKNHLKGFFYRILARRIDSVFCFTQRLKDILVEFLPIHKRKFNIIGAGINMQKFDHFSKVETETFRVGTIINEEYIKLADLEAFINSLLPLIENKKNIPFEIVLVATKPWSEMKIKKELVDLLHERGVDYKVSLKESRDLLEQFSFLDLYLNPTREPFHIYNLYAAMCHVPVLTSRDGAFGGFEVNEDSTFLETYRYDDSRELIVKCMKIQSNYDQYMKSVEASTKKLKEFHNTEEYNSFLCFYYEKIYSQRSRLAKRFLS
jgi:glycosyltransferase involved in cell wall biosynthesis